jgi:hypothetical protein
LRVDCASVRKTSQNGSVIKKRGSPEDAFGLGFPILVYCSTKIQSSVWGLPMSHCVVWPDAGQCYHGPFMSRHFLRRCRDQFLLIQMPDIHSPFKTCPNMVTSPWCSLGQTAGDFVPEHNPGACISDLAVMGNPLVEVRGLRAGARSSAASAARTRICTKKVAAKMDQETVQSSGCSLSRDSRRWTGSAGLLTRARFAWSPSVMAGAEYLSKAKALIQWSTYRSLPERLRSVSQMPVFTWQR